jgi:hypothetical protein
VSIEYTNATGTLLSKISAFGGTTNSIGGAGSVYLKPASSVYGDLTINNGGRNGQSTAFPSLGSGGALAGSGDGVVVTDRSTDIPTYFAGHWVEITGGDGVLKGTWRIGTISAKTITLVANAGETIDVQPGDSWQGVYRFDNALLRTTKVISGDPWRVTNPIDQASTTLDVNDGPPLFVLDKRAEIVVSGTAVVGPAGAVTDPHVPIRLTVTNTRTAATFTANANADGSFSVTVSGTAGDTFTIRATDSHAMPATSASIAVNGSVPAASIAPPASELASTNPAPAALVDLILAPPRVEGGATVRATVVLDAPAPAGGALVMLTSSSSNATVPESVTVMEGALEATFAIATVKVDAPFTVLISAACGSSASTTLTLDPPKVSEE